MNCNCNSTKKPFILQFMPSLIHSFTDILTFLFVPSVNIHCDRGACALLITEAENGTCVCGFRGLHYQLSILNWATRSTSVDISMMQTIENDSEKPHVDFLSGKTLWMFRHIGDKDNGALCENPHLDQLVCIDFFICFAHMI